LPSPAGPPTAVEERATGCVCVGIFGGHGTGKTTYLEHLISRRGLVDRLGRVEEGTSHLAAEPEEVRRAMSLGLAVATLPRGDGTIAFVDCPGEADFAAEAVGARAVADLALVFVAADGASDPAAVDACRWARAAGLPIVLAISRVDRADLAFERIVGDLAGSLGGPVVPLAAPVGQGASLAGVLDLTRRQVEAAGGERRAALPDEVRAAAGLRLALEEAAAEGDDDLLARYLDGTGLTDDEVARGVVERAACGTAWAVPVCAPREAGVELLAAVVDALARPRPVWRAAGAGADDVPLDPDGPGAVARVFKTMADPYVGRLSLLRVVRGEVRPDLHMRSAASGAQERIGQLYRLTGRKQVPVARLGPGEVGAVAKLAHTTTGDTLAEDGAGPVRLLPDLVFPAAVLRRAIAADKQASDDKLVPALHRLAEEDPSIRAFTDRETGELVVEGLGETHLDVVVDRLARKFGVRASLAAPRIPYRETVRGRSRAEGKHKKQSGGHGQYGHVVLEVEPLAEGEFAFVDKIFGGSVPHTYRPAVEKGVREAMAHGVVAGYPVTGVRVTLLDGSYHSVDSSELAFKIAAALAFEKACRACRPVLLEPVLEVAVTCPEPYAGAVMEDLRKRRSRILGMDPVDGGQHVRAHVPQAEMAHYATELRSLTGGWGRFAARPDHYAQAPDGVAERVAAADRTAVHAPGR